MPQAVWNRPVTSPASTPARNAPSIASGTGAPRHGQHDEGGAAGSHGAVHRQVGHVQDPERDVDADGHDAPDQSLGGHTRQGVDQMHDVQVKSLQNPPAVSGGNLLLYSSKVQRKGEAPFPLKVC